MGTSFVNYQIRSTQLPVVLKYVEALVATRAVVTPEHNGWISVYDEASESQDSVTINRFGEQLSKDLGTCVLAMLVHSGDVFVYYLFDSGDLIDEYNSNPNYFGGTVTDDAYARLAGQPATAFKYCSTSATLQDLEEALGGRQEINEGGFASGVLAEDRLRPFAAALGIEQTRATVGYNTLPEKRLSIPDIDQFIPIAGKSTRATTRLPVPPKIPPRA